MNKSLLATFSLISATLLYSSFGVLTRFIGFDLPVYFASFSRNLLGALLLLLPLFLIRKMQKVNKADWPWLFMRSCGGVLGFLGSYYAFYYLPMGTAYFIFYGGSTVMGFILGAWIFKEKISLIEGMSLLVSLLGLLLIYSVGGVTKELLPYLLWALAGGLGGAVWNTFSKKVSGQYGATQLNGIDQVNGMVIMLTLSLSQKEVWVMPSLSSAWLGSLAFALMFVITGQLMIYGFKYLDAQKGSLIMLMEVVFGALVGWIVYQETLGIWALVGGALILVGAMLPQIYKKK